MPTVYGYPEPAKVEAEYLLPVLGRLHDPHVEELENLRAESDETVETITWKAL